jgi:membrane protein YqaA with SNARE-associated domain
VRFFGVAGAALNSLLKLRHWIEATVPALGAGGIFLIAFLDSSFLTFPVINDVLVIELSILHPLRMPLYATAALLGSLSGSLCLFYLARKGGEVYWHRHTQGRAEHIRAWLSRNSFLAVAAGAILPPPAPFKLIVIAAGVLEVETQSFILALLLARGFRYFAIGFLAVRYGRTAEHYLFEHKLILACVGLGFVLLSYLVTRLAFRRPPAPPQD